MRLGMPHSLFCDLADQIIITAEHDALYSQEHYATFNWLRDAWRHAGGSSVRSVEVSPEMVEALLTQTAQRAPHLLVPLQAVCAEPMR